TFAAAADIHARQVPQEVRNNEYRPGAVPPEMPTLLAGSRDERVQRAEDLRVRATAVLEVTRNLIVLEAEDAFLRWEEASRQVPQARQAATTADKVAEDLDEGYRSKPTKALLEDLVNA